MYNMAFILIILLLALGTLTVEGFNSRPILSHVIFRHGERTPDGGDLSYPTDPYQNASLYAPYGFGGLTNAGKQTMYDLGKLLRNRYRHLIDFKYAPNVVYARTTDWERTKMSLQAVLAGLFPPTFYEVWNLFLNWQPIAYDYSPLAEEPLLFYVYNPIWLANFDAFIQNITAQGYFEPYQDLLDYISENSGWPGNSFLYPYYLYYALGPQRDAGLTLPAWTDSIYPDILKDLVQKQQYHMVGTPELRKIASGRLLKKIVDDTLSKLNGTLNPEDRSIFLYSSHAGVPDTLLITLGIAPEIPTVGSAVILELHRRAYTFGIQVYFRRGKEPNLIPLEIPGCGVFCPLNSFISLVEPYYPD